MSILLVATLVGLAGGIAVGLQGPLSSMISQRLGLLESVFIIHLGGALVALVPLLLLSGGKLTEWKLVPWYALAAGAFGLVVIGAIGFIMPRVGAATGVILIVAGQLLVSALLDHYGLFDMPVRSLEFKRVTGLLVVLLGVWLTTK
jgi:transporter family-2 protein